MYEITSQEILERISRHCPSAFPAYLQCLNRQNNFGKIIFSKDFVEQEMSESWTKFKNSIKKLALENLLEWHLTKKGIEVTMAAIDDDE
jgi:hypothetical protein